MALVHAMPGELIELSPLGNDLSTAVTQAFFKTEHLEVMRLLLLAGKKHAEHQVKGDMTVQCLEGRVKFDAMGKSHIMHAGTLLYLLGETPHSVEAIENSLLLLTIELHHAHPLVLAGLSGPV